MRSTAVAIFFASTLISIGCNNDSDERMASRPAEDDRRTDTRSANTEGGDAGDSITKKPSKTPQRENIDPPVVSQTETKQSKPVRVEGAIPQTVPDETQPQTAKSPTAIPKNGLLLRPPKPGLDSLTIKSQTTKSAIAKSARNINQMRIGTTAKSAPQAKQVLKRNVEPKQTSQPLNQDKGRVARIDVNDNIQSDESQDPHLVRVFYGTDRKQVGTMGNANGGLFGFSGYSLTLLPIIATVIIGLFVRPSTATGRYTLLSFGAAGILLAAGVSWYQNSYPTLAKEGPVYSAERGELAVGMCEVTIPREHETGELEAPSILRLELKEDAERHIVLKNVRPLKDTTFYDALKRRVERSEQRELFVFVHGYNVSFENAARRTAQMAFDLRFKGAAVFFSWPSQASLLKYTVDENNVRWSIPHLVEFLRNVINHSEAKSINVIAHSMGNRAMTAAVQQLSQELAKGNGPTFDHIVLAAPDVDADVFRRDLVPALTKSANRVTLYASSQDRALQASKQVHGYPRAGDSGNNLVVVPGIDTIDVSQIDTSLLGHSYYGSNDLILSDLGMLLNLSTPAAQRQWLTPAERDGMRYWYITGAGAEHTSNIPAETQLK